jgi:hypothetical protein
MIGSEIVNPDKMRSRKNGRNKLSHVSVPFLYFSVNMELVGSNTETVRVGFYRSSIFNPAFMCFFFFNRLRADTDRRQEALHRPSGVAQTVARARGTPPVTGARCCLGLGDRSP